MCSDCQERNKIAAERDSLRAELQAEQKARRWLEDQCLKAEAERDALRAENKDLWVKANQSLQECQAECDRWAKDLKDIPEQCNRLNDEKNRYREALEKIAMGALSWKFDVRAACKAALGEKPE